MFTTQAAIIKKNTLRSLLTPSFLLAPTLDIHFISRGINKAITRLGRTYTKGAVIEISIYVLHYSVFSGSVICLLSPKLKIV
jgi:hypothetical protein